MPAVRRRRYDDLFDYHNSRGYFHPYNVAARRAYTQRWFALAGRAAGVVGAVGTAAVSNLLADVPKLDTKPEMGRSGPMLDQALLPDHKKPRHEAVPFKDRSASDQISFGRDETGRKLSKVQRLMKLLASSMTIRRDMFGALSDQTSICGRYGLTFHVASSQTYCPLYLADLTSIVQGTSGATATKHAPGVMYRLSMDNTTDTWNFGNISGVYPFTAGQTYPSWVVTEGKHIGIPNNQMFDKALISSVDIGLILHGARNHASTVWVQLVQFDDENLCPPTRVGNSSWYGGGAGLLATWSHGNPQFPAPVPGDITDLYPIDTDNPDAATFKKFWAQQVEHLSGNPLSRDTTGGYVPGMKVLYNKRFHFQPVGNEVTTIGADTYGDVDGRQVVFNLKYHMDKVVDYNIGDLDGAVTDVELGDVNRIVSSATHSDLYPCIRPKGRVYLMIKASAPRVETSSDTTATNVAKQYASFDLKIERVIQKLRAETNI